ncbi:hypothetical protein [Clostridium sp. Cult2]|nr:hypothetical protein [Clostridium sp. Cult2]
MDKKRKKNYINIDMEFGTDINNIIYMYEENLIPHIKLNIKDVNDSTKKD